MGRFCTACGAPARDEGAFCQSCGAQFESPVGATSPGGGPDPSHVVPSATPSRRRALIAVAVVLAVAAVAAIVLLSSGVFGGVEGTYTLTESGGMHEGMYEVQYGDFLDLKECSLSLRDGVLSMTLTFQNIDFSFTETGTYSVESNVITLHLDSSSATSRTVGSVQGDQVSFDDLVWTKM